MFGKANLKAGAFHTQLLNRGYGRCRLLLRASILDRNGKAAPCQMEGDRLTDADGRAGYQCELRHLSPVMYPQP